MLTQEWFWQMLQAVAVIVTLAMIFIQIRVQTASHVVQTLATMHSRWNSESMLRARLKVCTDWIEGRRDFDSIDEYVAEFMEELGNYLHMKAIPARVMWEAQSWYAEHYFCMFRDGILKIRGFYHDPNLYAQFERLYGTMNRLNRSVGSPAVDRADGDLLRFAQSEIQAATAFLQLKKNPSSGASKLRKEAGG